jgi:hypothetical protein
MNPSTSDRLAPVTELKPVDVSAVRDDGMKALILLAVSLGWNVMHKLNQPVVITSREGVQRRIPTTTSARASYFQSNLSAIIVNSAAEPSLELMDAIIKTVKPSADHASRLRLAVGETPQQHRERLMNAEPDPEELLLPPIAGRIEIHGDDDVELVWEEPPTEPGKTTPPSRPAGVSQEVPRPADLGDHGELLEQRTHLAKSSLHRNKDGTWRAKVYESTTADERLWEDGYIDFVCKVCGLAFPNPRGVGSHKQLHIREGTAVADDRNEKKDRWTMVPDTTLWESRRQSSGTRRSKPKPEQEQELQPEPAPEQDQVIADTEYLIQQIKELLFPEVEKRAQELMGVVDKLRLENEDLKSKYTKVSGDLRALRELIGGMGET